MSTETYDQARVPPQDLAAEENVLGAMMLASGAIDAAAQVLAPEDFYRQSHGKMYAAALDLFNKGEPVDAITLADALDKRGELEDIGGRSRVHELAALVPASANCGHYATIVHEMAMLRGLISAGQKIAGLGYDRMGEVADLVDQAEQAVFSLSSGRKGGFIEIEAMLKASFERLIELHEAGAECVGTPSGFVDLDKLTNGFMPGNLIVIAARPSMGKTALGLGMVAHLGIRKEIPVALFTLEMSNAEVADRLICAEARVDSHCYKSGKVEESDWTKLIRATSRFEHAPIYVDDAASPTMAELRSKVRTLKAREPKLGLVIVDYLQLMAGGGSVEYRQQEVSAISRNLKVLARDMEVPVIALSQLSRAVESRHDKRPMLSDLRESGAIEQDADIVAFIYRDEYYLKDESEQKGMADIIIAKNRNGPTDSVKLAFTKRFACFYDLARV